MMIHEITPRAGRYRNRKRVGRGIASGTGKTSGRGHKGAHSRSGFSYKPTAEGGQMPLFRRLAKRGFSNVQFKKVFAVINLRALEARFDDGAEVNPQMLVKVGLIRSANLPVKILGAGELTKKLDVTAAAFSSSAAEKIAKVGGKATVAL